MSSLTPKQQRFVEEYLIDLNGKQAGIRAGYSQATAEQQASRLLSNVKVQSAIDDAMKARSKRTEITADRVLEELGLLGFARSGDYFNWGPDGIEIKSADGLTPEQKAAVAEVSETKTEHGGTVRVKLHDKRAALYDIGKHLGMFVDRKEIGEPGDFANLTDDQLDKRIDDIDRQVADLEGGKRAAQSGKASQATH